MPDTCMGRGRLARLESDLQVLRLRSELDRFLQVFDRFDSRFEVGRILLSNERLSCLKQPMSSHIPAANGKIKF